MASKGVGLKASVRTLSRLLFSVDEEATDSLTRFVNYLNTIYIQHPGEKGQCSEVMTKRGNKKPKEFAIDEDVREERV